MAISARRFLVVPDPAFDNAEVVSVVPVTGETPNEAGRQVAQPTRSTTDTPEGDIAMTLSGSPEVHVEGVARCTRAGVVDAIGAREPPRPRELGQPVQLGHRFGVREADEVVGRFAEAGRDGHDAEEAGTRSAARS